MKKKIKNVVVESIGRCRGLMPTRYRNFGNGYFQPRNLEKESLGPNVKRR